MDLEGLNKFMKNIMNDSLATISVIFSVYSVPISYTFLFQNVFFREVEILKLITIMTIFGLIHFFLYYILISVIGYPAYMLNVVEQQESQITEIKNTNVFNIAKSEILDVKSKAIIGSSKLTLEKLNNLESKFNEMDADKLKDVVDDLETVKKLQLSTANRINDIESQISEININISEDIINMKRIEVCEKDLVKYKNEVYNSIFLRIMQVSIILNLFLIYRFVNDTFINVKEFCKMYLICYVISAIVFALSRLLIKTIEEKYKKINN